MSTSSSVAVLQARGLGRTYDALTPQATPLTLFRGLSLSVAAGEIIAITGRSGSGKSTLLHLLAGLDRPSEGHVLIGGRNITALGSDDAAALRNRAIGYVWQAHYLLPEFSAIENVAMPLLARGLARSEAFDAARRALANVGLAAREGHRAGELSGGEQQRASIARALVTSPQVLLADEPTGDLDDETAGQIFETITGICRASSIACVLVTHNSELAARCDRTLRLSGGILHA